MRAEEWWHENNGRVPMVLWRCETGHTTQAVPVPDAFRLRSQLPEPKF